MLFEGTLRVELVEHQGRTYTSLRDVGRVTFSHRPMCSGLLKDIAADVDPDGSQGLAAWRSTI